MLTLWHYGEELTTWALFAELVVAGAIVIIAGARFTRLADIMSERLNIGSGWVGLILLATVTSLPEVATGSTATWIGNTGMATAALFGSCSFNITIIVLLNALTKAGSVLREVSDSHVLTSSFGLLLIGFAIFGILLSQKFADAPQVAAMFEGIWAVVIAITYLGCMRLVYKFEQRAVRDAGAGARQRFGFLNTVKLVVIAVVIVAASWWLARIGDTLSTHRIELIGRPLGATFVGAGFLALATSLPEITTSVSAARLGNFNLALGNIFGSNMFNIFVIPMLKAVSLVRGQNLLLAGQFNANQALLTGVLAILLTAITVGGLTYKSHKRMLGRWGLGFDSILIGVVYVGGMIALLFDG